MIVPFPGGSNDEVARVHGGAFAADRCECFGALKHEAKRRLRVAMRRGDFAGQNELNASIKRICDQ